MKSGKYIIFSLLVVIFATSSVHAQAPLPVPALTAKGVAIYGWKDGEQVPIYLKKEHTLFPVASITKLITAKVAEDVYDKDKIFTISSTAAATEGTTPGIVVGAQFTRDDLLKALLISSSNDAAVALMEPLGKQTFLKKMNDILHTKNYTATSFINSSGLDPSKKLQVKPNRLTPYHLTELLNDIYEHDRLLTKIMGTDTTEITNLKTNTPVVLKQTNALYRDELYKDKVVMSKTGLTNLAGQNLAFVTQTADSYDYITIVLLGSKNRTVDSKKVLDWLDANYQTFGG